MIPLLIIALGIGTALALYDVSPRARAGTQAFIRAIRGADEAHQSADAELRSASAAAQHAQQAAAAAQQAAEAARQIQEAAAAWQASQGAPPTVIPPTEEIPPAATEAEDAADAAVDHAAAATEHNQAAAQNTTTAAANAQTEDERRAVAASAAKVVARQKEIAAALASLGVGQCGVRTYPRVTERAKNDLLVRLREEGMSYAGNNPWNIDTRKYGVKLRAIWDPDAQAVKLIVTSGRGGYLGLVTCEEIWKEIDPIMREVTSG